MGLLGLAAYNVLQRRKEIGIRKVFGASVQNVVFLLSKDFIQAYTDCFCSGNTCYMVDHAQLVTAVCLPH